MSSNELPEYLYHYTTVEAITLILKNHKIRFRPLSLLDDKQEEMAQDYSTLSRFVYVSSWTDSDKESVPMWKMYSDMRSGVRIKTRTNMFHIYMITAEESREIYRKTNGKVDIPAEARLPSPLKWCDVLERNYVTAFAGVNDYVRQVIYTDEIDQLIPALLQKNDDGSISVDFNKLGMHKSTAWEFQHEWRYLFYAFMLKANTNGAYKCTLSDMNNPKILWGIDNIDIEITDDAFNDMEIVMSPKISESNRTILNLLKKEYNPSLRICESSLNGLIR